MIIRTKFNGYSRDGVRRLYMGGGGGGPTQSTSTSYQTNIPEYARPYVDTMLGATQKQLFEGTPTEGGGFDITGFKPYQPYSTSPGDYVAGFSPMQQQSQQTIAGMQVPGQYQAAADITGAGIMGAADIGNQARAFNPMAQQAAGMGQQYQRMATDPNAISAYMSPYMQNVVDTQQREAVRQSDIQKTANMGQATQQGAFGGGRQAIVEAERQRNLGTQLGGIQAQGSQNAFQQAQQAQQYGANLGLQGLQTGAGIYGQGLSAQQQAIQQALGGAGQLAGLGTQALEAQKGIAGLQGQVGAQQQSLEQQKINQAIQDYANAQQYPLMQLGTMSNMLRGLPMQAQTTNQYVAAPNALTQGIGMAGAGASLYNAFNPATGKAAGGVISMAEGGIASVPQYDVGGEVESDLESMPTEALAKQAQESPSPTIRQKAQRILRERQMEQSATPQGIQFQAPQGMAGGGIIAFQKGGKSSEELAAQSAAYITGAQAAAEARRQEALDADMAGDEKPLGMSAGPARPSLKEGLKSIGRGVSNAIARPAPAAMSFDSDYVPSSVPAAAATPAFEGARQTSAPVAAPAAARPAPAARPAVSAAAPVAAPTQAGIMAATQGDMDAGAAVGGTGSTMPATGIQAAAGAAQARADRPLSDFAAEAEAERKRLGLDKNVGQEEYRKQEMASRANAEDEAKRQKYMRLAQFFAKWGSTPGATLVAGMKSLESSIPGFIEDEKEQKKAKRESDKILYTLEEATRQEKLGNLKEATALKKDAAQTAMHLQQSFATQQTAAASDASRERSSRLTGELQLEAEKIRAKTAAASANASRLDANERKLNDQYIAVGKAEERALSDIAKERSSKEYLDLARTAALPESGSDMIKTQRKGAIDRLDKIDKEHITRAKTAADRTKFYERQVIGEATPAPTSKGISKAEFDKLPSKAQFTAPDGSIRTKP